MNLCICVCLAYDTTFKLKHIHSNKKHIYIYSFIIYRLRLVQTQLYILSSIVRASLQLIEYSKLLLIYLEFK